MKTKGSAEIAEEMRDMKALRLALQEEIVDIILGKSQRFAGIDGKSVHPAICEIEALERAAGQECFLAAMREQLCRIGVVRLRFHEWDCDTAHMFYSGVFHFSTVEAAATYAEHHRESADGPCMAFVDADDEQQVYED